MNGLTGLLKIELPDSTVLLSDGGVTVYNGDTYTATDPVVGSLASIDMISEGIGQEIPALDIGFAPTSNIAVTALSQGAIQQSRVRLYLAEYDASTGLVVGTPELRFIGFVDQPRVEYSFRQFSLLMTAAPDLEAMFFDDTGNGFSSAFHKSLYPGETGHDNATGLQIPVAWGVGGPATASGTTGVGVGGGSSASGGGGKADSGKIVGARGFVNTP